jgi:hypothetical protein
LHQFVVQGRRLFVNRRKTKTLKAEKKKKEKMATLLRLLHKLDKEGIDDIYLEKVGKQL